MYARAVDDAHARLRELRREEWEGFALGGVVLALALTATQVRPEVAMPLFLGGLYAWGRGMKALVQRSALVEQLAGDRDAYVIPDVLDYAAREATLDRRHSCAVMLRGRLVEPGAIFEERIRLARGDLEALVSELEDADLDLAPASAVACVRLLSELEQTPLLNPAPPPDELRSRVRQIRSGFTLRRVAA